MRAKFGEREAEEVHKNRGVEGQQENTFGYMPKRPNIFHEQNNNPILAKDKKPSAKLVERRANRKRKEIDSGTIAGI